MVWHDMAEVCGKAERPFEKPAVVVGVMPTAKRVLVQLSRRHAWEPKRRMLYRSKAWYGMVEVCIGVPVAGAAWHGMVWMVDVCDGQLAAEASRSSFEKGQCH